MHASPTCVLFIWPIASFARVIGPETHAGSTDRFLEFSWRTLGADTTATNATQREERLSAEVDQLISRVAPLYEGISGEQWLVGCFGWLVDLVFEWTGSPSQPYPIDNRDTPQWSAENATYDDIRRLVTIIRKVAASRGLPRLKVAALFIGWGHIYDVQKGPFRIRHPEIADGGDSMLTLLHNRRMNADSYPYATQPGGAISGQAWPELWGKQWGSFSNFAGFDGVVIRDGFSTYTNYDRTGPYGKSASANRTENALWLDGFRAVFREAKLGNPSASVIGYSQAGSAVGEWRVGLFDLEQIVADGYIDAWIDQSWPGAWQDVPTRSWSGLGWTHQLAYILVHRAQIEGGNRLRCSFSTTKKCRAAKHYVLHETFDSYEGWDTIHNVPQKLLWGIYAYNHAVLERADGRLVIADGQYISWANSWSYVKKSEPGMPSSGEGDYLLNPLGLMTYTDMNFLAGALNRAEQSTTSISLGSLAGPALVYDRPSLELLMHAAPQSNSYEWIDEHAGMLMKFGLPIMVVRRVEDGLDPSRKGGYILSVPSNASKFAQETRKSLKALAAVGAPVLIFGRADRIDPELLLLAGVEVKNDVALIPANFTQLQFKGKSYACHLSDFAVANVIGGGQVLAQTDSGWPVVAQKGSIIWAQLNDWAQPHLEDLSMANFGSGIGFEIAASLVRNLTLTASGPASVSFVSTKSPIAFSAFQSAGSGRKSLKVLIGSLETSFCGDNHSSPCSVPTASGDLELTLRPLAAMRPGSCWLFGSIDGTMLPRRIIANREGMVTFKMHVSVGSAHMFELVPCGGDVSSELLV
eukprot:TRINITY_DN22249_c0_g1_i2.p1 TRINITY_DN22249_c0_g1~~TRINITY_DN22249_c0_g1_i2.p1  ORF type:complete len:809 (-),score=43.78 TRINITY_DN22249_c0_g1_i2:280-2706(-)